MDSNFYSDLNKLGNKFGERMTTALDDAFQIEQGRNASKGKGVERSASSHVLEFYTPKTLRRVLEYVAIDYVRLNITIPDWAERMLQQDVSPSRVK